jgi:hypothetical protein
MQHGVANPKERVLMKTITKTITKTLSLAIMMSAGLASSVQAQEVVAADNGKFTQLCVTAASGNVAALHNKTKESGYSRKFVAKNVQCNGENILAFIDHYGKNNTAMINNIDHKSNEAKGLQVAKN